MADLAEQNATPVWRTRLNDASDRFKSLPNNKKILFLVALAAIFSVIVGAAVLNRQPSYKILFSNIADRDGGQVTAALQQMNIPISWAMAVPCPFRLTRCMTRVCALPPKACPRPVVSASN
jgi:hypothetical protein